MLFKQIYTHWKIAIPCSCMFLLLGSQPANTITDARDGKQYSYTQIGDLYWLTQNLTYVAPESECFDNEDVNCEKYGRLYAYTDSKVACPDGWRLPTIADWKSLKKTMKSNKADKIIVPGEWEGEDFADANNELGLSLLPSGRKDEFGASFRERKFGEKGISASFWLEDPNEEFHWHVRWGKSHIHKHGKISEQGRKFSIRCVCEVVKNE